MDRVGENRGRAHGVLKSDCPNAARLQKLPYRPSVAPGSTSGAASIRIARGERLRDSQEDGRTGGPRGFLLFEPQRAARQLRSLRESPCDFEPQKSRLADLPSSCPCIRKVDRHRLLGLKKSTAR